jgi:hypothetical protein
MTGSLSAKTLKIIAKVPYGISWEAKTHPSHEIVAIIRLANSKSVISWRRDKNLSLLGARSSNFGCRCGSMKAKYPIDKMMENIREIQNLILDGTYSGFV